MKSANAVKFVVTKSLSVPCSSMGAKPGHCWLWILKEWKLLDHGELLKPTGAMGCPVKKQGDGALTSRNSVHSEG